MEERLALEPTRLELSVAPVIGITGVAAVVMDVLSALHACRVITSMANNQNNLAGILCFIVVSIQYL